MLRLMNYSKQIRKEIEIMGIKQYRISLGLNQKEMAKRIGVSASYYYKVESSSRNPSFDFLTKLKNAFPNVCIDELFFDKTKRQ